VPRGHLGRLGRVRHRVELQKQRVRVIPQLLDLDGRCRLAL
jgi:hypothetical protein